MVEFVNATTGTRMWVSEDRVDEYKAAGHKLAAYMNPPEEPTEPAPAPVKKTKRKK